MRRPLIIGSVILLAVLIGAGIWLYTWVFGDTAAANRPISAIPLTANPGASGSDSLLFQIVPEQSQVRFLMISVAQNVVTPALHDARPPASSQHLSILYRL